MGDRNGPEHASFLSEFNVVSYSLSSPEFRLEIFFIKTKTRLSIYKHPRLNMDEKLIEYSCTEVLLRSSSFPHVASIFRNYV